MRLLIISSKKRINNFKYTKVCKYTVLASYTENGKYRQVREFVTNDRYAIRVWLDLNGFQIDSRADFHRYEQSEHPLISFVDFILERKKDNGNS